MEAVGFLILFLASTAAAQKISSTAAANGQNKTVYAYFAEGSATPHQLTCVPNWRNSNPQDSLSWDFTNAPNSVSGVDFVGSNGSVTNGILWLSFLRVNSNITGTYACVTSSPNRTSYTNFQVYFDDGSLSIGVIVGIVLSSIVLSVVAIYGSVIIAKRLGYISM